MPSYVVTSEGPIEVREIGGGTPEHPWVPGGRPSFPERPGHGLPPSLPPRDEWPELPPLGELFPPGVALPIPPTPEHPIAPLPPDIDPPTVWPPIRPEFPDMSGKSIVLALLYVSRHAPVWGWVVVDHEEAKEAFKEWLEKAKGKLPAGGIGGTPPQRPTPGR